MANERLQFSPKVTSDDAAWSNDDELFRAWQTMPRMQTHHHHHTAIIHTAIIMPPGESQWVCQCDKQIDECQTVTLTFPLDVASTISHLH